MTIESLSLPSHNTKLSSITIRYMINNVIITAITIHNVIIWRTDEDSIDVAQHGKNTSSTLILLDQIRSITNHQTHGDHHLSVVVDLPVPCYQERE